MATYTKTCKFCEKSFKSKSNKSIYCNLKCKKKQIRKDRKKQGLCTACGKEKVVKEKTRCKKCQEKHTASGYKTKKARLDKGLCWKCGKNSVAEEITMCEVCNDKYNKRSVSSYNKHINNNKCTSCGNTNTNGKTRCNNCLKKHKEISKSRRDVLIEGGLCIICKKTNKNKDRGYCDECANNIREYGIKRRKKLNDSGLCTKCGLAVENDEYSICVKCREKSKIKHIETRLKRKNAGLCVECGERAIAGETRCLKHAANSSGFSSVEEFKTWKYGQMSMPQRIIFEYIQNMSKDNSLEYNTKHYLDGKLELDIYSKDAGYAIEIDGPVHNDNIYGKNVLEEVIRRDFRKNIECKNKGITLYRIDVSNEGVCFANHVCATILKNEYSIVASKKIEDMFNFVKTRPHLYFKKRNPSF